MDSSFEFSPRGSYFLPAKQAAVLAERIAGDLCDEDSLRTPKRRFSVHQFNALARKFVAAKPQTRAVGALLFNQGSINAYQAERRLRCRSLSSRISELQNIGWCIKRYMDRDEYGQPFACYYLDGFQVPNA